ncbi:MAG: outer membrane protein assembly factor BamB [Lysobacteraceae bacterium]
MRKTLVVALLAALVLPGCSTVRDWFRSSNEKASAPIDLQDIAGALPVDELWSESLGEAEGALTLRQRPALDGGLVYAVTGDGALRAIDVESGDTRWEAGLSEVTNSRGWRLWDRKVVDGGLQSSVAVGEGLVVVAGRSGVVFALNAEDGAVRWKAKASAEVLAAPLVVRGLVVVRSQDGRTVAFDATTGGRKWSVDRSIPTLTSRGASTPATAVGLVLVGNDDGTVAAMRAEDGAVVWEAVVSEPEGRSELDRLVDVDGDLAVGADAVYATSVRGVTAAIGLQGGQVGWTRDNGGATGLELTAEGVLLADKGGTLWSLDRNSGSALWRQDALLRRQPTAPALAGSLAVVGDVQGFLHWFDPRTGELKARTRVQSARIAAAPLVSPTGIVIAVTDEGRISAYRVAE